MITPIRREQWNKCVELAYLAAVDVLQVKGVARELNAAILGSTGLVEEAVVGACAIDITVLAPHPSSQLILCLRL